MAIPLFSSFRWHAAAGLLALAGLVVIGVSSAASSAAAPQFGPIEIVSITAACAPSGGVTAAVTVRNRTDDPAGGQVSIVLAQHIPPSRGGDPAFVPAGPPAVLDVNLGPGAQTTLNSVTLPTTGVSSLANSLRVEADTVRQPELNPERSESFPPCAAPAPPTPSTPPAVPPDVTPQPPGTPSVGATPPTSQVLASPPAPEPVAGLPQAGQGPPGGSGNIWTPWLAAGLALVGSGATVSVGAHALRLRRSRRKLGSNADRVVGRVPVFVRVGPATDFNAFVDTLGVLGRLPCVADVKAMHFGREEWMFEVVPAGTMALSELARTIEGAVEPGTWVEMEEPTSEAANSEAA